MRWRRGRLAKRLWTHRVPYTLWRLYARDLAPLHGLSRRERCRLRQLTGLFLAHKHLKAARGLVLDDRMRLIIATTACLPILALGMPAYRGWRELIIYPDTFLVEREELDESGVVHRSRQALAGESADRGAMVLSWGDITRDAAQQGLDLALIIHECAHKLDALNGISDGCPPLHPEMSGSAWQADLSAAFARLERAVQAGAETVLDPYATHSPAEFLAVCSELFFTSPGKLLTTEPAVYAQLRDFYRQDPAQRLHRGGGTAF